MSEYISPTSEEKKFRLDVHFGSIEMQQRIVFYGNRMGYKTRKITRDMNGVVTKIGKWDPPSYWIEFPEPVKRSWWARLFGNV